MMALLVQHPHPAVLRCGSELNAASEIFALCNGIMLSRARKA
jgi:hypothetical protein